MNKWCLTFVCALVLGGLAVGQGTPGPDDYLEMGLREAQRWRQGAQHDQAIPIYQQLLNSNLDLKDRIRVHVMLADCYQYVAGEGENARQTWRDIRDAYPDDPVSLEAARRLGLLYFSCTPRELKPSLPDAAEQFEYALERAPAGRMIALLAHMNLGQIQSRMREREKALRHFQAVYEMQEAQLEVPEEAPDLPEEERERVMRPLRSELAYMRTRAVPKMVSCCIRATPAETIAALNALKERYPHDARIAEEVDKALKRYEPAAEGQREGETASNSVLLQDARNGVLALLSVGAILTLALGVRRWCNRGLPDASPAKRLSVWGTRPRVPENPHPGAGVPHLQRPRGAAAACQGCPAGRTALLLLVAVACVCGVTWGIALAAKHWDTEPEMPAPGITTPEEGTCVPPGAQVACTCSRWDEDHWTDGEEEGYEEDEMAEEDYPAWSCTVGSWLGGTSTGTQVTWVAPDEPCESIIRVTDDDKPKALGQGETGSRDDAVPDPTERQIYVVEVNGAVAIVAFQQDFQGENRTTDLTDTGDDSTIVHPDWTTADYNCDIDNDPNTNAWPNCNVVALEALLTPQMPAGGTIHVYFRLFDVDDPKWPKTGQSDAVDDDTVTKSGDNLDTSGAKALGAVLKDTLDTPGGSLIKVTVTGGGAADMAKAYAVITQPVPGNNWRFAASTRKQWLEGVYIYEGAQGDGITLKDAEGNVLTDRTTVRLTCWRRLHVEVDSMGAPGDTPPAQGAHIFGTEDGNSTDLTDTVLTDDNADWRPDNQLIGSVVDPDTSDTHAGGYVVTANTKTTVTCDGATMRAYAKKGDAYAIATHDQDPDDVPAPDTDLLAGAFAPACVTVVLFDTGKDTPNVPFQRNGDDGGASRGTVPERNRYWCVYLQGSYEWLQSLDGDPDSENAWSGGTTLDEPEASFIYKETIRDICEDQEDPPWNKAATEQRTVAHECGHHFELEDGEDTSCVMYAEPSPTKGPGFCPDCIKGIRLPILGHP